MGGSRESKGEVFDGASIAHHVTACAQTGLMQNLLEVRSSSCNREEFIKWVFPNPGWIKVNVDGSVWPGENWTGCGGVFRGLYGKWVLGFLMNLGKGSVLLVELRAKEMALRIAWENKFTKWKVIL
ncbi:Ribonuclease H-like superfamily [Sesbania bispinosa]|nr:Ribonuclease H-like superfamily [Sesbania bispinosa]